jgi:cation diffusion facilitator CzcD-associated flavoprotein CzcO
MQRRSVLLPAPLGPMMATTSPARDVHRDVVDHAVVAEALDQGVVANSHLWDPKIPDVPGSFDGVQLHSGEYHNVGDLRGSRVLVVGAGNSGCDLAVDVAQHRLEVD